MRPQTRPETRIDRCFAALKREGRPAFVAFVTSTPLTATLTMPSAAEICIDPETVSPVASATLLVAFVTAASAAEVTSNSVFTLSPSPSVPVTPTVKSIGPAGTLSV